VELFKVILSLLERTIVEICFSNDLSLVCLPQCLKAVIC